MKQAIVTGATGFIGSVFVETLLQNQVDVLALGRKSYGDLGAQKRKKLSGASYQQIDMKNIHSLSERIKKSEWVAGESCVFYNLAWGGDGRLSDLSIEAQLENVSFSVNALKAAERIHCEKFVHIGTMEEAFTRKYLNLDYKINNEYNRHVVYSIAKIASKNALKMLVDKDQIDLIFANNSHVMGPGDDKDSFLQVTLGKLIDKEELVFSSGEQFFDVISVKDCALAYLLIGQKGRACRDYWVGSGDPRRLREYVERMYNLYPSGREMQFGELAYNDISLIKEDFSISQLIDDTGFKPTQTYEETVKELYNSMISDGSLQER